MGRLSNTFNLPYQRVHNSASSQTLATGYTCIIRKTKCWLKSNSIQQVEDYIARIYQKLCFAKKEISDVIFLNSNFPSTSTPSSTETRLCIKKIALPIIFQMPPLSETKTNLSSSSKQPNNHCKNDFWTEYLLSL